MERELILSPYDTINQLYIINLKEVIRMAEGTKKGSIRYSGECCHPKCEFLTRHKESNSAMICTLGSSKGRSGSVRLKVDSEKLSSNGYPFISCLLRTEFCKKVCASINANKGEKEK
jgi:hypothetical protein